MKRLYPRPQLKRDNWIDLNGIWDFCFDDRGIGIRDRWYATHHFDQTIIVPFPYQSVLSEINDQSPHDRVWYRRTFELIPPILNRVILHFGAVDYESIVYVNGFLVATHMGGSTSFEVDITDQMVESGHQTITLTAYDPTFDATISRGKQSWRLEPFDCFYHRTTGIWQTVWIEVISPSAIKKIRITPDIDEKTVAFELETYDNSDKEADIAITFAGTVLDRKRIVMTKKGCVRFTIDDLHLWSPEFPHLYDVSITLEQDNQPIDKIETYFGMRKISQQGNRFLINNEPYFLRLILDQGYDPEGLLSYRSEDTLRNDILLAKQMGFNGCRKHEKIEAERFVYEADREGFLVSLEMPSAYSFKPAKDFINEWTEAIERDMNHPSLFMYVPFNESWGVRNIKDNPLMQDYVTGFYHLTKSLDPTRPVSANDGWEQTLTDLCAIHTYRHGQIGDLEKHREFLLSLTDHDALLSSIHTDGAKAIYVGAYTYRGEPIILSEFGGISLSNHAQEGWGYTGVRTKEEFEEELRRLFKAVYQSEHLAGFCYTQLTDVMQEINGLLTEHREPKIPLDIIKAIVTNQE